MGKGTRSLRQETAEECWDVTHRAPISLRWVDTNKGDDEFENYRSRIVVRELKRAGLGAALTAAEVFSAMPPTEALRGWHVLL